MFRQVFGNFATAVVMGEYFSNKCIKERLFSERTDREPTTPRIGDEKGEVKEAPDTGGADGGVVDVVLLPSRLPSLDHLKAATTGVRAHITSIKRIVADIAAKVGKVGNAYLQKLQSESAKQKMSEMSATPCIVANCDYFEFVCDYVLSCAKLHSGDARSGSAQTREQAGSAHQLHASLITFCDRHMQIEDKRAPTFQFPCQSWAQELHLCFGFDTLLNDIKVIHGQPIYERHANSSVQALLENLQDAFIEIHATSPSVAQSLVSQSPSVVIRSLLKKEAVSHLLEHVQPVLGLNLSGRQDTILPELRKLKHNCVRDELYRLTEAIGQPALHLRTASRIDGSDTKMAWHFALKVADLNLGVRDVALLGQAVAQMLEECSRDTTIEKSIGKTSDLYFAFGLSLTRLESLVRDLGASGVELQWQLATPVGTVQMWWQAMAQASSAFMTALVKQWCGHIDKLVAEVRAVCPSWEACFQNSCDLDLAGKLFRGKGIKVTQIHNKLHDMLNRVATVGHRIGVTPTLKYNEASKESISMAMFALQDSALCQHIIDGVNLLLNYEYESEGPSQAAAFLKKPSTTPWLQRFPDELRARLEGLAKDAKHEAGQGPTSTSQTGSSQFRRSRSDRFASKALADEGSAKRPPSETAASSSEKSGDTMPSKKPRRL